MERLDLLTITDTRTALLELMFAVASDKAAGLSLLQVTHGTEKQKDAVRRTCRRLRTEGKIRGLLYGEELHTDKPTALFLDQRFPELEKEKKDPGQIYLYLS